MIRIVKPPSPKKLSEGVQETSENCDEYDLRPADYHAGTKRFSFPKTIYGHKSVRETLKRAQHRKCCFCEGTFLANAAADVEHYRPKGAVRQDQGMPLVRPGYYWLAYEWENLYWCCQTCNRSNKREFFPLRDPAKRAVSHHDDIAEEEPLILDPGGEEDPRKHITFRQEWAIGITLLGETTIRVLDLNREDLIEDRLTRLGRIRTLREIVRIWTTKGTPELEVLAVSASQELESAIAPESPFSAMAADYLSAL